MTTTPEPEMENAAQQDTLEYAAYPMFPEHKAMHIDKNHKRAEEAKRFCRTPEAKLAIDLADAQASIRRTIASLDRLEAEGVTELEIPSHE